VQKFLSLLWDRPRSIPFKTVSSDLNLSTIERRFEKTFRNKSWRASPPPRDEVLSILRKCRPHAYQRYYWRWSYALIHSPHASSAIPHNVSAQTVSAPVLSASRRAVSANADVSARLWHAQSSVTTCAQSRRLGQPKRHPDYGSTNPDSATW
jgi:hypothetical protein